MKLTITYKAMIIRSYLNKFLYLSIFLCIQSSILGQVDTVFSDNGKILEIGETIKGQKQGKWTTYHNNGTIESVGSYENGEKTGKWIWYHDNGQIFSKEKFEDDNLKKGKCWDSEGNPCDFSMIQTKPEYPGGIEAFRQMIADNLQYPKEAADKGIEGNVFLQFNIDENGELTDLKIIRGVNPYLDREAYRVVSLSETWKPGTYHGKNVKVSYIFPVVFVLY